MSDRPLCERCLRPEASDEDWRTVPGGGRPDLCWGRWERDCADARGRLLDTLLPALRAWREADPADRAAVLASLPEDGTADRMDTPAVGAALSLLRAAGV